MIQPGKALSPCVSGEI